MLCHNLAQNSLHTVNMSLCWLFFLCFFVAFFIAGLFLHFKGDTQEYLTLKKEKRKKKKEDNLHKDSLICLIILAWAEIGSQQNSPCGELSDCLQL